MEALEQMVDMTAKLFECDRDEMYCYILRLCSKSLPCFHFCVCFSIVTGMCTYIYVWVWVWVCERDREWDPSAAGAEEDMV